MSVRSHVGWCLAVLLSLLFVAVGGGKFVFPSWEARFAGWGYPPWARPAVGALEVAAALLLLPPRTRRLAALALVGVMAGAAATHLVNDEAPRVVVNLVLTGALTALVRVTPRRAI